MPPPSPFWNRSCHADRRPFLLARGRIKAAIRRWFEGRGFVEVEPACLQVSPGNETHLHAFGTALKAPDGSERPLYLHTSPEFACKKLLAAGEPKIFTFAPSFRNRERGALHAPEFTMLEWYEVGAPYDTLMTTCFEIMFVAAEAAGATSFTHRDCTMPIRIASRITLAQAFSDYAAIDLLATVSGATTNRHALAAAAQASGTRIADDDTWSDIVSRVLVEKIEPHLGRERPAILYEYPVAEAALARPCAHDPRVAERFELYACGVELANGFGELTDAAEQRRRFETEMAEKERLYGERYPIDEDFLAALAIMPGASGCALGFDRLVMLATGAMHIDQVQWTPLPVAGER